MLLGGCVGVPDRLPYPSLANALETGVDLFGDPIIREANLLDLMVPPLPDAPPVWRNGEALVGWQGAQGGDLQWFANDYRDHEKGGRWYQFDAAPGERIWRCIDPWDQMKINGVMHAPPRKIDGAWVAGA
jgi:hypothetical protein